MHRLCAILCIAWVGCGWILSTSARADGLYVDFSTSAGAFTVELNYVRAPRTVAHFIRMAEGWQSWMDPVDGVARTNPWYAGSGLYKVQYSVPSAGVTNRLALQGGLRAVDGAWSGGPGYAILDEATNGLSHSNGVIAMVTDGPHTGAAEFMILLTNGASYWDGRQTVFGRVSAGTGVVQAIAGGGQTGGQLVAPAVISAVTIRRVGTTAESFVTDRNDLPDVQADGCRVDILGGGTARYVCVQGPQSETIMAHQTNLPALQWALYSLGFNGTTQAVEIALPFSTMAEGWSRHFFHGTRVDYPVFSAIPLQAMSGITFAAQESDGTVYQYWLNLVAKTGFWQNVTTTGAVVKINDCLYRTSGAHSTQFNFMDQDGNIFDYTLGFDVKGATMGRYYMVLTSAWTGDLLGTEWGDCQYAAWNPGAKTKRTTETQPSRTWPERREEAVAGRGIRRLEPGPGRAASR